MTASPSCLHASASHHHDDKVCGEADRSESQKGRKRRRPSAHRRSFHGPPGPSATTGERKAIPRPCLGLDGAFAVTLTEGAAGEAGLQAETKHLHT